MILWNDLIRFLRLASGMKFSSLHRNELSRLAEKDLPWEQIIGMAELEETVGLLYHNLERFNLLSHLPELSLRRLLGVYLRQRKRNLVILDEMRSLSTLLGENSVQAIALQGLALIATLYEEPGLRQLGDVDLMIRPDALDRFKGILRRAGYHVSDPAYPELMEKGDLLIDIHTHPLNLSRIKSRRHLFPQDLTPMWAKAEVLFRGSSGLLGPNPRDLFCGLCAHALKHGYSRLIWLVDLHEWIMKWIRRKEDWEMLLDRSRLWHQEKAVLYALLLIEWTFGFPIPHSIKEGLGIRCLNVFEKHLLRLRYEGLRSRGVTLGLWLCSIEGVQNKIAFLKETAFPREEIMTQIFENKQGSRIALCARRVVEAIALLADDFSGIVKASSRVSRRR